MNNTITKSDTSQSQPLSDAAVDLFGDWFDPIEPAMPDRAPQSAKELIRSELDTVLASLRYNAGRWQYVPRARDRQYKRTQEAS